MRRLRILVLSALLLAGGAIFADWWSAIPQSERAHFVGGSKCIECHTEQHQAWTGSHHDLAMQVATEDTVLGDFNNTTLEHHGITSRMFRRGNRFFIETEGPDGELGDFEIKYCFGVEPLQQYMVEFAENRGKTDTSIGRLQVLRICWDTEQKHWFYLAPPDVADKLKPTDDLHWTGIAQRWNTMCADCHSTNLRKNFDSQTLSYKTTFTDIDVNCESCHGPGSHHVHLATALSLFWDRRQGYGLADLADEQNPEPELQSCAPCHSRRRVIDANSTGGATFFDHYGLELPSDITYFADGQILDEVYEYGSFLQSKMYHKKIRCSDCHNPHSARLEHTGNAVCTSCHQHPAGKYDSPGHHQHQPGSKGAACVNCHMPETTYMDVDSRRDHSLRVPRPDLSVQIGVPNACTGCHLDRAKINDQKRQSLQQYRDWVVRARKDEEIAAELTKIDTWAAGAVEKWFPESQFRTNKDQFAQQLVRAWTHQPDSKEQLLRVVKHRANSAVIRAAAWQSLASYPAEDVFTTATQALKDPHPLVRSAAARVLEGAIPSAADFSQMPPRMRDQIAGDLRSQLEPVFTLTNDPIRLVRLEAATVLTRVPSELLPAISTGRQRESLYGAITELKDSWRLLNDRAAGHGALALIAEHQGNLDEAIAEYRLAIRVEPNEAGPRSNLALLLEQLAEAGGASAAKWRAEAAELREQELVLLARDAHLAPELAEVRYRYGMALYLNGQHRSALQQLERAAQLRPDVQQYALAVQLLKDEFK